MRASDQHSAILWCVFFFKQKTAYELRISDWSSDVCSSDLAETGSGKTEAALWRFARLFAEGKVDGLYFAVPTRSAARQLHAREIGSASCRERVCQYV